MEIRHTTEADLPKIMKIYEYARKFMAEHGNAKQWGPTNWPPEDLIRSDIADGNSYVVINEDEIVATFYFNQGKEIDPTYKEIEDGAWMDNGPYGVVHRIASNGTVKGIGNFCIDWAMKQCAHLRMDTHGDNKVMQNLLEKSGFVYCGIIYVSEDNDPRLAYEKIGD